MSEEIRNPKSEIRKGEGRTGQRPEVSGQSKEPAGEMLTKRELAGRLKIAARTVENWQRRGILSYIKVGKVVLFHWPDVVAYLKCNYQVSRRSLRIRREVIGAGSNTGKTL
jgi:excisionase family DNA binding protein